LLSAEYRRPLRRLVPLPPPTTRFRGGLHSPSEGESAVGDSRDALGVKQSRFEFVFSPNTFFKMRKAASKIVEEFESRGEVVGMRRG
jgi:hypothetical protein